MKKMLSLRTKAEVLLIGALLLGIGISSVMSTTTWYNVGSVETLTTDQSDFKIDFANNWIRTNNITNTKGNVFEFDGDDDNVQIQEAIYDLNDTDDGKVIFPSGFLWIADVSRIPDGVTLEAQGN